MNSRSLASTVLGEKGGPRATSVERGAGNVTISIDPQALCEIFGVDDPSVATRLLSQLLGAVSPGTDNQVGPTAIKEALALVEGIGPNGTLEAMTATLLVAAHNAALDCMRRAMHPDQTPGGRSMYLSLALKASRTFAQLRTAFDQGRGQGVVRQEIMVQHVTVEAGARAVVGPVNTGRG